jgi:hypothetical protein
MSASSRQNTPAPGHGIEVGFHPAAGCGGGGRRPSASGSDHATVAMTLDTYPHAVPALQQDAAATIAGIVARLVSPGRAD